MWFLLMPLLGLWSTVVAVSGDTPPESVEVRQLAAIVREFQEDLGIEQRVVVSIVDENVRLVSVYPSQQQARTYVMEFDRNFLATLSIEEQRAAVAHEMGHVWIFTHREYAQSERLANETALRLTSRESLEKVYVKVWKHDGQKGSFEEFLGPEVRASN
jgi:hypothetical protein